jgi:hypothetical protein
MYFEQPYRSKLQTHLDGIYPFFMVICDQILFLAKETHCAQVGFQNPIHHLEWWMKQGCCQFASNPMSFIAKMFRLFTFINV